MVDKKDLRIFARFYQEYNPRIKRYIKCISVLTFHEDDEFYECVISDINKRYRKRLFKKVNIDYIDKAISSGYVNLRKSLFYLTRVGRIATIEFINEKDLREGIDNGKF